MIAVLRKRWRILVVSSIISCSSNSFPKWAEVCWFALRKWPSLGTKLGCHSQLERELHLLLLKTTELSLFPFLSLFSFFPFPFSLFLFPFFFLFLFSHFPFFSFFLSFLCAEKKQNHGWKRQNAHICAAGAARGLSAVWLLRRRERSPPDILRCCTTDRCLGFSVKTRSRNR